MHLHKFQAENLSHVAAWDAADAPLSCTKHTHSPYGFTVLEDDKKTQAVELTKGKADSHPPDTIPLSRYFEHVI